MYLRRVVHVMHLTLEDQPTPYVPRAIAYITDRERCTLGTELEELKWDALERKGGGSEKRATVPRWRLEALDAWREKA
jgi:hypothetical protein